MSQPIKVPDQSALLYRTGYLTTIPDLPGGTSHPATELLYLNQYGDEVIATLPAVNLGHGVTSGGTVQTVRYRDNTIAFANFRAMVAKHNITGQDGWTVADLDAFDPSDLSTLRPAAKHRALKEAHS